MSLEATYEIIDRAEKTGFADASEGRPARVIGFKFPNEARAYTDGYQRGLNERKQALFTTGSVG
jgi:hypothetical protein